MADLTNRPDRWTGYLPETWQHSINTNPLLNALGRALSRPAPNLERASLDIFGRPEDRAEADRQWLLHQARGPSFLERMNPVAQDAVNKLGLYANFVGPAVKLPGVPKAPGRYAMDYPGGRLDYKDLDAGGVHVSGIYTNPEARGQGNARQALQELIAAADAAKRPMSLEISPGAPGVDPARLRQWYESLGFQGPDYAMTRPLPQEKPTGIRAYHGSPHDFDKFDIRKSGGDLFFSDSEVFANTYRPKGGRTYEVNINASPDQFLDLDVPFSQQSALVKNSLKEAWRVPDAAHGDTGRALYSKMIQKSDTPNQYEDLAIAAGIPGLKYKDALAGKASQSYVLWDDSLVEILRKYGLWPLVPAGTAAALNQQEPQL